ncbi:MAG: hypothetical protein WC714_11500 [Candidatus Obscuribacterales bacterium]|jgi:hypothetical protein
MSGELQPSSDGTRLISLSQLQDGTNQDQELLEKLGRLAQEAEDRRSNRQSFIVLYVVLSLLALLGGLLSAFVSIVLLFFVLPQILRATAPEKAEPTILSYSLETGDSTSVAAATRYKKISDACQNLSRADAFFLAQPLAKAIIRKATEIQINDLEFKPWCIGNDRSMLYFFPDYIVIREDINHALLPYELLRVTLQAHSQVLTTNNPALITFIAPQGPFFELLGSNPYLAESFCDSINSLSVI